MNGDCLMRLVFVLGCIFLGRDLLSFSLVP